MNKPLKVIETKRLVKECIQDALEDCKDWKASIVLGITKDNTGRIWYSDITPSELTYLKEVLNCHIRDIFGEAHD